MREYLQVSNLLKSMVLGGAVTVAAVPRIVSSSVPADILIPAAFCLMTLVAGTVMAWGRKGGMVGAFPERSVMLGGMVVALVAGLAFGGLRCYWGDRALRAALTAAGETQRYDMCFPTSVQGKLALVLWASGFQVLFFQAGAMSFLTRILKRWEIALVLVGVLRILVLNLQLDQVGLGPIFSAYTMTTASTLVGATLFARSGFPAAALFAACIELRLLWL